MPANQPSRARHGFTLVELLVVVGLIGLLLAILLPTLSKARRAAYAAACLSNVHQIANAVFAYAANNGNAVQFQPIGVAAPAGGAATRYINYYVYSSGPVLLDFDLRGGLLSPYLNTRSFGDLKVWECPTAAANDLGRNPLSDAAVESQYPPGSYGYQMLTNLSYGFNPYLQPPVTRRMGLLPNGYQDRLNHVQLPAQTMLCADSGFADPYANVVIRNDAQSSPYGWGVGLPCLHGRHNGQAVVAWVDGHATLEPVNVTLRTLSMPVGASIYAANFIGYLTPNARYATADASASFYYEAVKGFP